MLGILLFTLVTPIILLIVRWYYLVHRYEKYLKDIPGPNKRVPLLGDTLDLGPPHKIVSKWLQYSKEYNGTFKFYVGSQPYLNITHPKDIEFLLSSTTILRKSDVYRFLLKWLGLGLLLSWGNRWRKHRKIITPAFHFQILEDFIEVFNAQTKIFVSRLKSAADAGPVDITPFVHPCTLDIICETSMGTSFNAQGAVKSAYIDSVNTLLTMAWNRGSSAILSNDLLYPFTTMYRQEGEALKIVHGHARRVIANKRKELESTANREQYDSLGKKKRHAFLDLLVEHALKDSTFTNEDIREETDTFLFEGYETTATSTTFALYSLATNPDVQKKVYEEIKEIFADDPTRNATYKDLQDMKYLDLVIKESLRLYTTVPVIGRVLEKDVDFNGTLLPKGLMVHMFLQGTHISDTHYPNPEKFDPERFTSENSKGRNPYVNVPFSAGPRNCIGQRFALLLMKVIISNTLRSFELRPAPAKPEYEMILTTTGVLRSEKGVFMQLKDRE